MSQAGCRSHVSSTKCLWTWLIVLFGVTALLGLASDAGDANDPFNVYLPSDAVYRPSICVLPSGNDASERACGISWRLAPEGAVVVDVREPPRNFGSPSPSRVTPVKNFTTLLGAFGLPFTYGGQSSVAVAATLSRYAAQLYIGSRAALALDPTAAWDSPYYPGQLDVSICDGNFSTSQASASEYFVDPIDGVFVWTIRSAPLTDCSVADSEANQCNLTAQVQVDSNGAFSILYREVPRQYASQWLWVGLGPSTWGDVALVYSRLMNTSTTPAPHPLPSSPTIAVPSELVVSWAIRDDLMQCLQFTSCSSCPKEQDCVWAMSFGGGRGQCVTMAFAARVNAQFITSDGCETLLFGLCRRPSPQDLNGGWCATLDEVDPELSAALLGDTNRSSLSIPIPANANATHALWGIVPVNGNEKVNLVQGPVTATVGARGTLRLTDSYGNFLIWTGFPRWRATAFRQTRVTHRYCSAPYENSNVSCVLYSWSVRMHDSSSEEAGQDGFATWSLVYFGASGVMGVVSSNLTRLVPDDVFPVVSLSASGNWGPPIPGKLVGGPTAAMLLVAYLCMSPCYYGTCGANGECLCSAMWQGSHCNIPSDTYLVNTTTATQNTSLGETNLSNVNSPQRVSCPVCGPRGRCDVLTGMCKCEATRTGPRCEYLCDPHRYNPSTVCNGGNSSSSSGSSLPRSVSQCTSCACFVGWTNSSSSGGGMCNAVAPSCNVTPTGTLLSNVRDCFAGSQAANPVGTAAPPSPSAGHPRFPLKSLDANEPQWTKTTTLAIALVLTIFGFLTSIALQQVRIRALETEGNRDESTTSASTNTRVSHVVRLVLPPPRPLVKEDEQALCRRR